MKKVLNIFDNKVYITPLLFGIFYLILAFIAHEVDKSITLKDGSAFAFNKDLLQPLLLMTIGAIITLVTITFSSIMVVLTTYSGQFSPRTLNDFLVRKVPLRVLGYFTGLLTYSAVSLLFLEDPGHTHYMTLTLIVIVSLLIGFVVFAYYIHYISKSIQINLYIDRLVGDATKSIKAYQTSIDEDPMLTLEPKEIMSDYKDKTTYDIKAYKSGYITDYDKEAMTAFCKENDAVIIIEHAIDTHIYKDDVLFSLTKNKTSIKEDALKDWVTISSEPSPHSAYLSSMLKLTDIAVRALSPGINDPRTAIHCVDQLGHIINVLSSSHQTLVVKEKDTPYLIMQGINFDHLLYDVFYQIIHYGKEDYKVVKAILTSFIRVAQENTVMTQSTLWAYTKYLFKDIPYHTLHPFDHKDLFNSVYQLAVICNKIEDYNTTFKSSDKSKESSVDKTAIKKNNDK
ncbi:MAG: DUF2254 domain-containing protein [Bacillota bacterium]